VDGCAQFSVTIILWMIVMIFRGLSRPDGGAGGGLDRKIVPLATQKVVSGRDLIESVEASGLEAPGDAVSTIDLYRQLYLGGSEVGWGRIGQLYPC